VVLLILAGVFPATVGAAGGPALINVRFEQTVYRTQGGGEVISGTGAVPFVTSDFNGHLANVPVGAGGAWKQKKDFSVAFGYRASVSFPTTLLSPTQNFSIDVQPFGGFELVGVSLVAEISVTSDPPSVFTFAATLGDAFTYLHLVILDEKSLTQRTVADADVRGGDSYKTPALGKGLYRVVIWVESTKSGAVNSEVGMTVGVQ
jgi:hypothetical protein